MQKSDNDKDGVNHGFTESFFSCVVYHDGVFDIPA